MSLIILFIQWKNLKTEPFRDVNGNIIQNSVASLERVKLGGIEQTILIRGKNINNHILLYLHGGPGISDMGELRKYNSELENYFVVVNWDQRGAGKSYSPFILGKTMNVEQFLSDANELVTLLRNRFKKEKIYLIGHSWGSLLGVYLVKEYPKNFYAYIGTGQIANWAEGEKISLKFTLREAIKAKNEKAIKQLKTKGVFTVTS